MRVKGYSACLWAVYYASDSQTLVVQSDFCLNYLLVYKAGGNFTTKCSRGCRNNMKTRLLSPQSFR